MKTEFPPNALSSLLYFSFDNNLKLLEFNPRFFELLSFFGYHPTPGSSLGDFFSDLPNDLNQLSSELLHSFRLNSEFQSTSIKCCISKETNSLSYSVIAFSTLARVSTATRVSPLITRDTVWCDTLATAATSRMVGRRGASMV
jgi:hypothetical protein